MHLSAALLQLCQFSTCTGPQQKVWIRLLKTAESGMEHLPRNKRFDEAMGGKTFPVVLFFLPEAPPFCCQHNTSSVWEQ